MDQTSEAPLVEAFDQILTFDMRFQYFPLFSLPELHIWWVLLTFPSVGSSG